MSKLFDLVNFRKPKYNTFDLSHERKLSCNMAELIPILLQEVVPGDKFQVNSEILIRMAPMVFPIMHRINVFTHYFFVPNRLVWDNWEDFITGGEAGTEAPTFPIVQIAGDAGQANYIGLGSLLDYFGLPPKTGSALTTMPVNALPFRAYQEIWNEYYRDQNLQSPIDYSHGNTVAVGDDIKILALRKRCWEKDYYTAALPWAQRGNEVKLPLSADIIATLDEGVAATPVSGGVFDGDSTVKVHGGHLAAEKSSALTEMDIAYPDSIANGNTTITELRRALKLQEWLERSARAGSRYIEQIKAHFGVFSSDARLQRPEYLGGGKNPVVISEVLNTSDTASAPQGAMAGHGISIGNQHRFRRGFEEHGFIIGIMSILPRTAYQQGINKMFLKTDKFEYFWPEFAHIGEQAVEDREVYFDFQADNLGTFGYQPRYSEYKFQNSSVHGEFRDTLKDWHMGRIFDSKPSLNASFVEANPTNRIFPVEDSSDKLFVQIYNDVKAIRPMPVFGEPLL